MEEWDDLDPSWDIFRSECSTGVRRVPPLTLEPPEPRFSPEEVDAWERDFRLGLFAGHYYPFAFYVEPEAFALYEEASRGRIQFTRDFFQKHLPQTSALAERMLERIPQTEVWGVQRNSGDWFTETAGERIGCGTRQKRVWVPTGVALDDGEMALGERMVEVDRTRPGKSLAVLNLVKHFAGRTNAVGTTDQPRERWTWNAGDDQQHYMFNHVAYLRIDVDQDSPWKRCEPRPILAELGTERAVAVRLGLPYQAFRTGRRGCQAVLPLPCPVYPCTASFILESYLSILNQRKEARWATLDATNLNHLMRLPGGKHAVTEDLALWIDIDGECLYPLDEQIRLMVHGFGFTPRLFPEQWDARSFRHAAREITEYVEHVEWGVGTLLNPEQMAALGAALPDNALILRSQDALAWMGATNAARQALLAPSAQPALVETAQEDREDLQEGNTASLPAEVVLNDGPSPDKPVTKQACDLEVGGLGRSLRDWTPGHAEIVWREGFQPGGFQDWIKMDGKGGILAAVILFGKEQAVEKLVELALRTDARRPEDRANRVAAIHSCWRSFRYKDFAAHWGRAPRPRQKLEGDLSDEVIAIAQWAVQELLRVQPKAKWRRDVMLHTILLLLAALEESPNGMVEVSFRDLAESINNRWPDAKETNHMRVKEAVQRITLPGEACLYPLLYRRSGAAWNSEPDQYRAGRELKHTQLGCLLERRRKASLLTGEDDGE